VEISIRVRNFGFVGEEELDYIISLIRDCYKRIGKKERYELELYLFPDSNSAMSFMKKEKAVLKVTSAEFGSQFLATHDAWRGRPRIMLRMDLLRRVQPLIRDGCIRHEVGHSVLHGSPEYYKFGMSSSLLSLGIEFGLSNEYLFNVLYLTSIAVKDYEVTRLLVKNGFLEDQIAYVSYLLEPSKEDLEAYELARSSKQDMALYMLSCLKTIGCAVPLLKGGRHGKELWKKLEIATAHIPKDLKERLFETILGGFFLLGDNTFSNIDFMLDLLVRTMLRYIFKEHHLSSSNIYSP
jgi:hypothetical protein